jgi:KipI family sensor histidine kinase inhibitor
MQLRPIFRDCAESALCADFGDVYSVQASLAILSIACRLAEGSLRGIRESVPALSTLTIFYDPLELSRDRLVEEIEAACATPVRLGHQPRTWTLPTLYGGGSGPDLLEVAAKLGISSDELIHLHCNRTYHVYMLGFLPGFAYLGDVDEKLRLPRRSTPRARVPAGSVAIASDMTAIYPPESPGGWHILGYTPVPLWDMNLRDEPLFRPGDQVRFQPVGAPELQDLEHRLSTGWLPEPEEAA